MAFSMSEVKRKVPSKQADIKACYYYVYNNDILTENVKTGLWKYCNYRFSQRNRGKFNETSIQEMTKELLEKVCRMPYNSIGIKDVMKDELDILYHIKRAIYFGATRTLYYEDADYKDVTNINNIGYKIEKPRHLTCKEEVLQYLEDIRI